jgi:hypothetical protein
MTIAKNYNYTINYQLSIYDIIDNSQVMVSNLIAIEAPYLLQAFKLTNNLFLLNVSSLMISLIYTSKTTIYNNSITEGNIVKLVENKDNNS